MSTRPVIFISAVSKELHSARDLVAKTLIALGYDPKWQDIAPTETGDLRGVLRKWVDDSAAVLQLIGHCYGFAPKEADPDFGECSYTQYEALYARQQGKPVYYIFTDDTHPTDGCGCEPKTLHDLQEAYRKKVKSYGELYHSTSSLTQTELLVRRMEDKLAQLRAEARASQDLLHQKADQALTLQQQNLSVSQESLAAMADLRQQLESFMKGGSEQRLQQDYDTLLQMVAARHGQTPDALVAEMRRRAYALVADPGVALQTKVSALREAGEFIKARDFAIESAQHLGTLRQKATQDEATMWTEAAKTELSLGHYAAALQHAGKAVSLTSAETDFSTWSVARQQQGWALSCVRNDKEAQALYEELIPLQQGAFGPDDVAVLLSRRLLAVVMFNQAAYAHAEQQARALMASCQRVLGAEHPDSLSTRMILANTLGAQGRHAEAELEHRALLQTQECVLGAGHPSTLASRNNLAVVLQAQGRHAEAEQEHRAVLEGRERVLGAEHPDTLSSRNNLANTLDAQGKHAEAEQELRAVLQVMERVLGAEHPTTLAGRNNLANTLLSQGKHFEAEQEHRVVVQLIERVIGAEHPAALMCRMNLAAVLQVQGKLAEAEPEHRAVLNIRERVLGAEHPEVALSCYNLADCLKSQQKLPEALAFIQRAEQVRTKVLGPEHPDTKDAKTERERLEAALKTAQPK